MQPNVRREPIIKDVQEGTVCRTVGPSGQDGMSKKSFLEDVFTVRKF
jgi:hypothetical protein